MKPFRTVLCEADGNYSATRFCLVLWTVVVLATWTGLSVARRELVDVKSGVVQVFGIFATLKWGQIKHESDGAA